MKQLKLFAPLKYFWAALSLLCFWSLGQQFAALLFIQNPDISGMSFTLYFLFFILCLIVLFVLTIVIHELGHLVFGLKAGLKFIEFNVLTVSFYLKDNKLKTKLSPKISGIGGYCNLNLDDRNDYPSAKITMYFLGGILFNIVCAFLCALIILLTNNVWMQYLAVTFAFMNVYLGVNNAIPQITKTGMEVDMLKIINHRRDPNYIKVLGQVQRVTEAISNGALLRDMDIVCPQQFNTQGEILLGLLYLDYIIDKEEFDNIKEIAQKIRADGGNIISNQNNMLLSLQVFRGEIATDCNIEVLAEIWTKKFKKYLNLMSGVSPLFLGCKYAFVVLVDKNEQEAQKILQQVENLNPDIYEENDIKECHHIIQLTNSKRTP